VALSIQFGGFKVKIVAYCDGAYSKTLNSAGIGISFTHKSKQYDYSLPSLTQDSNDAEIDAAVMALSKIELIVGKEQLSQCSVVLYSDSDFLLREAINKSFRAESYNQLADAFKSIDIKIIKSHKGAFNHNGMANEHVDRLAKSAMNREW
jgi:ribonuclease HI